MKAEKKFWIKSVPFKTCLIGHRENILNGKVIICTHPEKQTDELKCILASHGANVISMPMIEVHPAPFQLKRNINEYDWLVFTSQNAVDSFLKKYSHVKCKIAAIGDQTAGRLKTLGVEPAFIGCGKSAGEFADELLPRMKSGVKVLLVLGKLAPDTLLEKLNKKANVDRVNVYETILAKKINPEVVSRILQDKYDAIVVTSPSAYQNLRKTINSKEQSLRLVSIGKTTTAAIINNNEKPLATSEEPGYKGLAYTIINYFNNKLKN